jgi:pyridoxal phosphate enzyme (YggS family)
MDTNELSLEISLELSSRLAKNLSEIRQRIDAAARRSGREASQVRLVAVTKYVGVKVARKLAELGCRELGESRPQRLWELAERWNDGGDGPPPNVAWHLVGRLQRNKVARTLPLVSLIHSIDSERLLDAVNSAAEKQARTTDVLLEAFLSGDEAKQGFAPGEIESIAGQAERWPNVRFAGLMTMAPLEGGLDAARPVFVKLRELRERLAERSGGALNELSMGMSGDFEVAIEEGATIVRIGSALFEGLPDDVMKHD